MRTTKHALGLVERRQERLRKEKASVAKEQRNLQLMRGLALGEEAAVGGGATVRRDEEGFMDIREPYNEAEEQKPRSSTSSREARGPPDVVPQAAAEASAGDVLARLRELERQEEEEGEQEDMDAQPEDAPGEQDEMAELDAVMAQAEAGTLPGVADSAAPRDLQREVARGPELRSPADLFARMRQIEEEARHMT